MNQEKRVETQYLAFNPEAPARRWTRKEAEIILEEWKAGGTSLSSFARERGLKTQRLAWWRKRLRSKSVQVQKDWGGERPEEGTFIPAVIHAQTAGMLIRLGHGVEIEISEIMSPAWVAELGREVARLR